MPDNNIGAPGDNIRKLDPALAAPALPGLDQAPAGPVPESAVPPAQPLTATEQLVDPLILAQVTAKAREFSRVSKLYEELGSIDTADMAAQANDFLAGAKRVWKVIDGLRMDAKRPYDDKAKAIHALFTAKLAVIDKVVDRLTPMLEVFRKAEQARAAAKKLADELAARIAADLAAAELAAAKATGDAEAEVAAEEAVKDAAKLEKQAAKPVHVTIGSATGATRALAARRSIVVQVEHFNLALAYYKDRPEIRAALISLAQTEARAAGVDAVDRGFAIQGFKIYTEEGL